MLSNNGYGVKDKLTLIMTQEDKQLLLIDLCGRLPYGVKIHMPDLWINEERVEVLNEIFKVGDASYCVNDSGMPIEHIKPYLFPLSSMTEEQKEELFKFCDFYTQEDWEGKKSEVYGIEIASRSDPLYCYDHNFYLWGIDMRAIDWLNKNHFDYRGLIPKGLANDATGLNIY